MNQAPQHGKSHTLAEEGPQLQELERLLMILALSPLPYPYSHEDPPYASCGSWASVFLLYNGPVAKALACSTNECLYMILDLFSGGELPSPA